MEERVRIDQKDGIADVRLVRADKMNAIDLPMFVALVEAGKALARDASVRAVVLSGEGRAFSAGIDLSGDQRRRRAHGSGPNLFDRSPESPANLAQRAAWIWQEVPVPVIAAVHGVAYGAGLQIALGADIRFVAPDAKLSVRETYWGLVPDVALTQTLRNVVGLDVAKELTFTARIVSGTEAVALRLATHVCDDPHRDAMALAREIAERSPDAVRAAKKLLNTALLGSVADGLRLETELQTAVAGGANQREAVRANFEKRAPRFRERSGAVHGHTRGEFREPWAMTFLPDGRLLVTEKKGALKLYAIGAAGARASAACRASPTAARAASATSRCIRTSRENQLVYLSYAEAGEDDTRGAAVARAELALEPGGGGALANLAGDLAPGAEGRGRRPLRAPHPVRSRRQALDQLGRAPEVRSRAGHEQQSRQDRAPESRRLGARRQSVRRPGRRRRADLDARTPQSARHRVRCAGPALGRRDGSARRRRAEPRRARRQLRLPDRLERRSLRRPPDSRSRHAARVRGAGHLVDAGDLPRRR